MLLTTIPLCKADRPWYCGWPMATGRRARRAGSKPKQWGGDTHMANRWTVGFTDEEAERLAKVVAAQHLPVATWLRAVALQAIDAFEASRK